MSLHEQHATFARPETKIRLSLLGTALVDALGAPAEFHPRFTFEWVTDMIPNKNFGLSPGVWTDDTSMTLCLAESLSKCKDDGGFSEVHQLDTYSRWKRQGHLSAVGRCFDIGNTIRMALSIFAQGKRDAALSNIRAKLGAESNAGNGSLMRVLPIGLVYWRNLERAKEFARRSSSTTHPTQMCTEACEIWTGAISLIMQHTTSDMLLSKLALFEYFATYPYQNRKLKEALAMPSDIGPPPDGPTARETWYQTHHPLLRLIADTRKQAPKGKYPYALPSSKQLPSTGYVLHTFVAALFGFFATNTFEEGAIMVVNLGDDADTVGAIYAGLSACWYAGDDDGAEAKALFWSDRVQRWEKNLVERVAVEHVAEGLASRESIERAGNE
ncbi:hypothetical protein D9619_010942 [Psilocybe cf. subviscida]|uniref:ADP-ribosylhydrolase ARH3 n=1 Tax=Psilocybe cf. subviscida TaxID=2480587 RepID=A0A8H5F0K7_9AGAR|nr:hypothetical protein D9619_010942 [Psilocybe cf. subviscida]